MCISSKYKGWVYDYIIGFLAVVPADVITTFSTATVTHIIYRTVLVVLGCYLCPYSTYKFKATVVKKRIDIYCVQEVLPIASKPI